MSSESMKKGLIDLSSLPPVYIAGAVILLLILVVAGLYLWKPELFQNALKSVSSTIGS